MMHPHISAIMRQDWMECEMRGWSSRQKSYDDLFECIPTLKLFEYYVPTAGVAPKLTNDQNKTMTSFG
jgi:hypothetical protein